MANGGLIALAALAGVGLLIATSGTSKAAPGTPGGGSGIPKPPPPPPITGLPPIPGIPPIPTIPPVTPPVFPGLPPGFPDNGIAGLPDAVKSMVNTAMLFGSPDDMETVAVALDASGQHKAAQEVRVAEAAKRAAGGGGFIPTAPAPSDIHHAATAGGFRSNPTLQWTYIVASGDSPTLITHKIIADERRYPELLAANPLKPTNGRPFPEYNFLSLLTGEQLLVPKLWNQYINTDGAYNGMGVPLLLPPLPDVPDPLRRNLLAWIDVLEPTTVLPADLYALQQVFYRYPSSLPTIQPVLDFLSFGYPAHAPDPAFNLEAYVPTAP